MDKYSISTLINNLNEDSLRNLSEEEIGDLFEVLENSLYQKAREDFLTYVRIMAPLVLENKFEFGRHLEIMCRNLEKLESGEILRLMIFMPPRSGKTIIASVLFPSWCMGKQASRQIIHVGHTKSFAADKFGKRIRDLIRTEEFRKIFPECTIRIDSRAKDIWETDSRGKYACFGAQGQIAGIGGDIGILDDIISEQTAYSDIERNKINEWYHDGFRSRMQPDGRELIINTRWHLEDISGYLLSLQEKKKKERDELSKYDIEADELLDEWTVVSFPAILDKPAAELLGLPEGGSYWPERWPVSRLKKLKAEMTPQKWAALYMQNPVPGEGSIIKEEWIQKWEHPDPPFCEYKMVSLDTAFSTSETADYSAYSVWGIFYMREVDLEGRELKAPNIILLASGQGRWEFPDLCNKATDLVDEFDPDAVIIEKKASGQSLIQELRRRGVPVMEYTPDKDKISRANAAAPIFYNERVWLPPTTWAEELKAQLIAFPFAAHDDLVDTTTQAIIYMRDGWKVEYLDEIEEEDRLTYRPKRLTYWGALKGSA